MNYKNQLLPLHSLSVFTSTLKKELGKHTHVNWTFADQAVVSGANFLTGILLARYLGLEAFGVFTLVWMAILFINSVQFALISSPMMSIGPQQPSENVGNYYGAVFTFQLTFAIGSALMIFAGVKIYEIFKPQQLLGELAMPLASVAFAFQIQDFIRRYFFTRCLASAAFKNDLISYLGQVFILLLLYEMGHLTVPTALWTIAGTSCVAIVVGVFDVKSLSWDWDTVKITASRHWLFSKWLSATALMQWTSGNLFIIAAAAYMTPVAAGALRAAQNIIGVSHILFQAMENFVPVRAAQVFHAGGITGLRYFLTHTALYGGIITGILAMGAILVPELWLKLFYGNDYAEYGYLLQWYAVIYIFVFIGVPVKAGLRALEHTKPLFLAYVFMTGFSLILASVLVKELGLVGALFGMLGTQIILQGVSIFSLLRRMQELN